ncbi:MAG: N-acetylglucosamine-6-phosphate deacetylase [Myxococcota bacterium]
MGRLLLRNALLIDPEARAPEPGALLLEDGRIAARLPVGGESGIDAEERDLAGRALAPGFVDLHYHGPVASAEPGQIAPLLAEAATDLLRHGTTAFLATTLAWEDVGLADRVDRLTRLVTQDGDRAACIGIHLEGPWIHPGAAGAQPAAGIRPYTAASGGDLLDRCQGSVRMVTLAPEVEGAPSLQAELQRRGIVAALGHSLAHGEQVATAVERGARHVTHLFNAMGGLHQREPGLAGAALCDDRLTCDLICDGAHVHPDWVRTAARAKGERLVLISDRVDPGDGDRLVDDGVALRSADGRLFGSRTTLDRCVRNFCDFAGVELHEAVTAATLRPARVLGIESERGSLRPGARADLVVLGATGELCETWLAGRQVFSTALAAR